MAQQKKPKKPVPDAPKPAGPTRTELIRALRSKHGAAVVRQHDRAERYQVVPTGSYALDDALGTGGYVRGRLVEVWGQESTSKTTLALHACANAQKMGLGAALVDAEHALDTAYAESLGVNMDELFWSQPDSMEQAYEIMDEIVDSGLYGFAAFDSIAAPEPQAVLDGDYQDSEMGSRARLTGKHIRYVHVRAAKTLTACMYINQVRQKIGVMFGSPNTTTGGNALKFFCTHRISLGKAENGKLMAGVDQVGQRVKATVVKNKVARPHREAEYDIVFGSGIDRVGDVRDAALAKKILIQEGTWYLEVDPLTGEANKVAYGRAGLRLQLEEQPELLARLEQALRAGRSVQ